MVISIGTECLEMQRQSYIKLECQSKLIKRTHVLDLNKEKVSQEELLKNYQTVTLKQITNSLRQHR